MKTFKKLILLIAIFISTIAFSQKTQTSVLIKNGITTSQRNSITIDPNTFPEIYNSDTNQAEQWNGSAWDAISGGGAGNRDFVASGAISTGQVVGLRSDGKVEIIEDTVIEGSYGTSQVFESASTTNISATYDSSTDRIVIAYTDIGNSSFGTAVVGEVSGTTITFGTPVVYESSSTTDISITFDSNENRVVIAYNSSAIVGEVTAIGNVIAFGTAVEFETTGATIKSITFDSNENRVVIAYQDFDGATRHGKAIVGEVTAIGNVIAFGTIVTFNSANSSGISATFDSNENRVVIAYRDTGDSSKGKGIVGEVTGGGTNSISFGTAVEFESGAITLTTSTFDSNENRIFIAYIDGSTGKGVVGEVTAIGNVIAFGTAVIFENANTSDISATFDSSTNKILISYADVGNSSFGTAIVGEVTAIGNVIAFGTPIIFNSASSLSNSSIFDSFTNQIISSYTDNGNSAFGTSKVYIIEQISTNVNTTIGIATEAIADTVTGTITIISGVNDQQSGLTPGVLYYVQFDGVITATPNQSFDFKELGFALSATEILMRN